MKCPHCSDEFKEHWTTMTIDHDPDGLLEIDYTKCSKCDRLIVKLTQSEIVDTRRQTRSEKIIHPQAEKTN